MRKLGAVGSQGFAGGKVCQEGPLKGCKEKNQPPVEHSTVLQISRVRWESDSSSLGIPICKLFGWSCGDSLKLKVRDVGICFEDQQGSLKKSSIQPPSKLYSYPFVSSLWAQWYIFKTFPSSLQIRQDGLVSWLIHASKYFNILIDTFKTRRILSATLSKSTCKKQAKLLGSKRACSTLSREPRPPLDADLSKS